ncbi:MAG: hypothetical protein ACJATA_001230 [Sphingobacteriales bacterium]|jgi:hypothetical protein
MKNKLIFPLISIVLIATTTGCASIFSKNKYDYLITSVPENAKVEIFNRAGNKVFLGQTPIRKELPVGAGYFRKEFYTIKLEKPGFENFTTTTEMKVDPWYYGNIVSYVAAPLFFLVGDPNRGNMFKPKNTEFRIYLTEIEK